MDGNENEDTTTTATTETSTTEDKTFSQSDVDRIVRERLARQKAQYGDYDDLKAKAGKFDEIEQANQSELEKANERAAKAERDAAAAQERAQRVLVDSSIATAAAGKLADPTDAVAMIDRASIEFGDDGTPTNIGALVDALVESKPHLAAGATRKVVDVNGGARGGAGGTLDTDALMQLGDKEFLAAVGKGGVPTS